MDLSTCRVLRRCGMILFAAALFATTGCGGGKGTISGKVVYKASNPQGASGTLKGGHVSFIGSDKAPHFSEIKEDGSYQVTDVPVGPVKITVETSSLNPKQWAKSQKYSAPPGMTMPGGNSPDREAQAKRYRPIPQKYEKLEETPLTYTVKGGRQDYEIVIEGP